MPRPIGRLKPFSVEEIGRRQCRRCSEPSRHQWDCCANDNRYIPCCQSCADDLAGAVMEFLGVDSITEAPRALACLRCSWSGSKCHHWHVGESPVIDLCGPCDVALNRLVLQFFRIPNAEELLKSYVGKIERAGVVSSGPTRNGR